MTSPGPTGGAGRVGFPSHDDFARKFFAEAVRHLGDARILHRARRYPGAITSCMKSAELAIKAALALDGCLGWWDLLQQTYRPLQEIEKHQLLSHHYRALANRIPSSVATVKAREKLAPGKPNPKEFGLEARANTEYPFFHVARGPGATPTTRLDAPGEYFRESESLESFRATHELLATYQALYPEIRRWRLRLPRPV